MDRHHGTGCRYRDHRHMHTSVVCRQEPHLALEKDDHRLRLLVPAARRRTLGYFSNHLPDLRTPP